MLNHFEGVISIPKNNPYHRDTIKLPASASGGAGISIEKVDYCVRTFEIPTPIEIGLFYGEQDSEIPALRKTWGNVIFGRMDNFQDTAQPESALITNRDKIDVYLYKRGLLDELVMVWYRIWYQDAKLSDINVITLNRSGGYSSFTDLF